MSLWGSESALLPATVGQDEWSKQQLKRQEMRWPRYRDHTRVSRDHGLGIVTREDAGKASVCTVSGRNNLGRELRKEIPAEGTATVNAGVGMLEEHPGGWCGQSM